MASALEQKDKIISYIQSNGPSLPVKLASELKISPLFASAFLSELYGERKIKISNIRVGSSPLYYISGQEVQLENFIEHLNQRERDAFLLVKDKKILEDSTQTPVIRVALNAIKDFAIPTKINESGKEKLFWKYHLFSDLEAIELVKPKNKEEKLEKNENREHIKEEKKTEKKQNKEEKKEIVNEEIESNKPIERKIEQNEVQISVLAKNYIENKKMLLLSVIVEKKKEFHARVHTNTMFGPQHFYIIAKDKKKASAQDIESIIECSRKEKMPGIFLCPGEPDKKAQSILNEWINLIKFEKIYS